MLFKLAVLFGALAIGLGFIIGIVASRFDPEARAYDPRVASRFLERGTGYTSDV